MREEANYNLFNFFRFAIVLGISPSNPLLFKALCIHTHKGINKNLHLQSNSIVEIMLNTILTDICSIFAMFPISGGSGPLKLFLDPKPLVIN